MNARFWTWHNGGWVKLTMRPGQRLGAMLTGGRTDEGWTLEESAWHFDGMAVYAHWFIDGVDCDGRMSRNGTSVCMADQLKARDMNAIDPCAENAGIFAPEWEARERSQRDYAAEAAGY